MPSAISQLQHFLQTQSVLTLATLDSEGIWSAPVLYAADIKSEQPKLYFLSSASSRHIKSLSDNSQIAASIYAPYKDDWQAIKGVQMKGQITKLDDHQRESFESLYFSRFPEISKIIERPNSEHEEKIASAFVKSGYFYFSPTYIRITDNSDSFANRREWFF